MSLTAQTETYLPNSSTPYDQTHFINQQLTPNQNQEQLLERIAQLSLEEQFHCKLSKKKGLPAKYRKMLKNMVMSKSSQHCTVCISSFVQEGQIIKKFPCKHILHRQCAKQWLNINKTCPVCRLNLQQHFRKLESTEDKNSALS